MSLVVKDLTVDHGAIRAISEVSFTVETGKLSAVILASLPKGFIALPTLFIDRQLDGVPPSSISLPTLVRVNGPTLVSLLLSLAFRASPASVRSGLRSKNLSLVTSGSCIMR